MFLNSFSTLKINTFLIGAQKAGTTSIYNWIGQHPDVYAPLPAKDYHHFSDPNKVEQGVNSLHEFYKAQKNETIIVNGAVNYMFIPNTEIAIKKYNPSAKIIIILREPIARAVSGFQFQLRTGNEENDFVSAIDIELKSKESISQENAHGFYLKHGLYYNQVKRFVNIFGKANVLVLVFEKFMQDKNKGMEEIFNFLKIKNNFQCNFDHLNKGTASKFKGLNNFLFSKKNRKYRKIIKKILCLDLFLSKKHKNNLANKILEKNTKAVQRLELDENMKQDLKNYFKSDIQDLSKLLGIDLFQIWY